MCRVSKVYAGQGVNDFFAKKRPRVHIAQTDCRAWWYQVRAHPYVPCSCFVLFILFFNGYSAGKRNSKQHCTVRYIHV